MNERAAVMLETLSSAGNCIFRFYFKRAEMFDVIKGMFSMTLTYERIMCLRLERNNCWR